MAKSKKAGKAKTQSDPIPTSELGNMDYWRNQATLLNPKITDEWHLSELATALHETAKLMAANYPAFSKIIDRGEANAASIGLRVVVDRTDTPPTVEARVVYREAFGQSVKVQVPDPSQQELPLEAGKGADPGDEGRLLGDGAEPGD